MRDTHKDKAKADDFRPLHSIAVASGAGLTMLTCIGLCVYAGLAFDEYFGTSPAGLIVLAVFGGVTGVYSVIRQILGK